MANRYVRLYRGPEAEPSTVIGFSMSAWPSDEQKWDDFFDERGYSHAELDWRDEKDYATISKIGGVSMRYVNIEPPIADEHLGDFASLCARLIDPYHNGGYLIDHRYNSGKIAPFDTRNGVILGRW